MDILTEAVNDLDNRLTEVEKEIPLIVERHNNTNDLLQKNIAVLDKLESAFQDNRLAMQTMAASVEQSNKEIASAKRDIKTMKDERNLNIVSWLKTNFVQVILLLGVLALLADQIKV